MVTDKHKGALIAVAAELVDSGNGESSAVSLDYPDHPKRAFRPLLVVVDTTVREALGIEDLLEVLQVEEPTPELGQET